MKNVRGVFPIKSSEAGPTLALTVQQQSAAATLPQHLVFKIISHLALSSVSQFTGTCRYYTQLTRQDSFWEVQFRNRFLPGLPKGVVVEKGGFLRACKKQHRINSNLMKGVCALYTLLHDEIAPCSLVVAGGRAIAGFADGSIKIWDLPNGACVNTLNGHDDFVSSVALQKNTLYSGGLDGTIKVWDFMGDKCLQTLSFGEAVLFLAAEETALFAGFGSNRLRDISSSEPSMDLTWLGEEVKAFAIENGKVFLGFADGTVRMVDPKTEGCLAVLKGREVPISALAVGQGKVFAGYEDGKIEILNRRTGQPEVILDGHTNRIIGLVFAEGRLYSGSFDRTIRMWDFGAPDKVILGQLLTEIMSWDSGVSESARKRHARMPQEGRDEDFSERYVPPIPFEGDLGKEEYYHQNWVIEQAVHVFLTTHAL